MAINITPGSGPARLFGIQTSLSGDYFTGFIAQSVAKEDNVQTAQALNEVGTVIDAAAYQRQKTYTIEALNTVDSAAKEAGNVINIGGEDALINQISTNESNTDFSRSTLQVLQYDDGCVYHSLSSVQNPNA